MMRKQSLKATIGKGPIVCIIIEGNDLGIAEHNQKSYDGNLPDEENRNQEGFTYNPTEDEQNMPDPEKHDENFEGDEDDLEEIPMEEPIPDMDETDPDGDLNTNFKNDGIN